ncbi:MAG: SagB/ThcOx family dehydrogenase [Candidatus Eisenbacteria bacterium]
MHPLIKLPAPSVSGGPPIWGVLSARRSIRHYGADRMPLEVLSQLLWATHGVTGELGPHALRNAPSAGACYPIEAHLAVNSVFNLEPGLYRYLTDEHALMLQRTGNVGSEITSAALGQKMCEQASVTFVWTAVLPRTTGRYGQRGHRYVLLDAGHVGQNMYLAATSMGYGCCTIGAFDDEAMNEVVGVDGVVEVVLYAASVGPLE